MKRFTLIVCISLLLLLIAAAPVAALTTTTIGSDTISTVSPSAGSAGTTIEVTITGGNFTSTTGSVRLEKSGEDDIDGKVTSWSTTANQIICSIKIPKASATGKWNVVVVKGYDGSSIVLTNGFTVTQAMSLTSISPTSGRAGRDIDYTITGSNLDDVAKVYLYNKNYDNITDSSPDTEDTKVKGTFDLTDADEATYEVCLVDIYKAVKCGLEFDVGTNKKGSIDVSSSPSGASIFLDGIANGTTPATLDDVIVGSHKVILRKSGYEEWGKTVTVTDGDTTEVDAKLYAVSAATAEQTANPTPVPTTPRTTRTTVKSTIKVPTTYAEVPTTATASPLDPMIAIGAAGIGIGLVMLRRR
jgi:hypothetical protein